MQTFRLLLRDLRAVSLGLSPGRRPPPSMRPASRWKGTPPLPSHPRPTSAVGLPSSATCGGTGDAFALPCPPEPSLARPGPHTAAPGRLAYGDRPGLRSGPGSRRAGDPCPPAGAGLARPEAVRGPRTGPLGVGGARQVCVPQTAGHGPHPALPRGGRQDGGRGLQDQALAARATAGAHASLGLALGRSGMPVRSRSAGG